MVSVDNYLATVEQFLNPIDYVPVAASFSGMVRILASSVQVVAGTIFGVMKALLVTFPFQRKIALREGYIYTLHGIGNILRGCICMIPFVNIGLYFYDKNVGRMNYPNETMNYDVYPLMTAHLVAKRY